MKHLTVVGSKLSGSFGFDGLFVEGGKLSEQDRAQLQTSLRIPGLPPPAAPASPAPAADATDVDAVIKEFGVTIEPEDVAALKADPIAAARFRKNLVNRREIDAEKAQRREAAAAADKAQALELERNRLAALGSRASK